MTANLLSEKIKNLPIKGFNKRIRSYLKDFYYELDNIGFLHFKPKVYFGDEWFCADGEISIFNSILFSK